MYKISLQLFYLWICLSVKWLPNRSVWICCYSENLPYLFLGFLCTSCSSITKQVSPWSFLHEVFTRCLSYSITYDYSDSEHLTIKRYVLGCRVLFTCGKSALPYVAFQLCFSSEDLSLIISGHIHCELA